MTELIKKVCVCGDPSVGKTSLVKRFVTGKYDEKYISTLGTMISKKYIKEPNTDINMTMMIWDVSGQREFQRIHAAAFKNATAGFVVCDMTRPDTISRLPDWVTSFREHAGPNAPVTILVNKADLTGQDKKTIDAIQASLERLGLPAYKTSAKTGNNVEKAFSDMASQIIDNNQNELKEENMHNLTDEVPEHFASPQILLDYIMIRFCDTLGDHELGMYILRKQISDMKVNFQKITKEQVCQLVTNLTPIMKESKNDEKVASHLKLELMNACERCSG
ncbi:MAG: Rab family GTPase [Thermoplasmata archaeon]